MLVSELNTKHADWVRLAPFWDRIALLKCGGWEMSQRAEWFLQPRPMEPQSVYAQRLQSASYQNIFGTALGWYSSRLFHDPPQFGFRSSPEDKTVDPDPAVKEFLDNADGSGTSLVNLARTKWFADIVALGCTYVVIDLPVVTAPLASQRAQAEAGALDPYLVSFDARQVIDWDVDEQGNYKRIVIATQAEGGKVDRWYIYDETTVQVWEAERKGSTATTQPDDEKRKANLVRYARHALASFGRVPVRRLSVPEELWFGWRVYPQVVAHYNADNAYQWLLLNACIPVPVITGEYNEPPARSEVQWISLAENGKFSYTEPSGVAFQWAAARVEQLKEEVHRQMYLQHQAAETHAAQSGLSKQMDMQPSTEVLDGFGAIWREAFEGILKDVLAIRGQRDVDVDVQGLTFDDDNIYESQAALAVLDLGVPSETFRREVFKRVTRAYLKADPDKQKAIDQEIDSAPDQAQSQQAAMLEQAAALAAAKADARPSAK
ncbi:MAG: hypothetical protein EPO02_13095 [Nitrospirae bacterium]|nr:MAG: hypothetical protein EPO02_13095 [Nitrospirota bacterium]